MSYNYKIVLQYEGTRYQGWQKQVNTDNTIQGKLEYILEKLVGMPIDIHGSGRTDAGVHAKAQVANFVLANRIPPEESMNYFNQYLPEDMAVIQVEEVTSRLHSRLTVKHTVYVYRIRYTLIPDVFKQ